MSDYISKSALIEELQKRIGGDLDIEDVEYLEKVVNSIPTVDEKEIIRKPFERVVERLEQSKDAKCFLASMPEQRLRGSDDAYDDAIEIVKEVGGLDVELGKYHCLGTVEELKEAREKQVAKKVVKVQIPNTSFSKA